MYKTGCIDSPKDLRNYRLNICMSTELPETFQLDNTTILDQKEISSCVAHALSSVMESIYKEPFSVGWLYGNRNVGNLKEGMHICDALKTARKLGCVKKKEFDYNIEMIEIYDKVNQDRERLELLAEPFKIGSYAILNNATEIKTALLKGIPIICSIKTPKGGITLTDNVINLTDEVIGSHAIMIYGYNEIGFMIQNSWGKEWGNNGTAILPYEYPIKEAWAISPTEDFIKPNFYFIREIIEKIIKILRQLFKRL